MIRNHGSPSSHFVFSARDLLSHLEKQGQLKFSRLPVNAILCFSPHLALHLAKKNSWPVTPFLGARFAQISDRLVLVSGFGIGAPAAVAKLEELRALGVQTIATVGTAGAIQSEIPMGCPIIVESAYSDEGTSRHYANGSRFHSDSSLVAVIRTTFKKSKLSALQGTVCTTDAPYREQRRQIAELQRKGVLGIEMELSAVYAAAQVLGLNVAGVVVTSDHLKDNKWQPGFGESIVRNHLTKALLSVIEALQ